MPKILRLEYICRKVRRNDVVFGGIQVIASGCFKQLPPVPSSTDPGLYAFQSEIFKQIFPHRLHLTKVIRQNEMDLITAVQELSDGTPSIHTEQLLKDLSRPIVDSNNALYIFGTNKDCDYLNELKLDELHGVKRTYIAEDDSKYTSLYYYIVFIS